MGSVHLPGLLICIFAYISSLLLLGALSTAGLFGIHVIVVPLIFKYSKLFRRTITFANFVQWPLNIDFEDPSKRGINGGRNLYIEYFSKVNNCKIKLGIWHIVPNSSYERLKGHFGPDIDKEELNRLLDEDIANSGKPIVMYCHGNANSRGATHRIDLYRFLQNMDYHIIGFDYRGYGDSTNIIPSEEGVVEDALLVYDWLHTTIETNKKGNSPPVFIWGHSLGTGISSNLLGHLEELSRNILEHSTPLPQPKGLLLEAPFNNLAEEVANYPLSRLVQWLPYHDIMFIAPFRTCREHQFRSDEHLLRIRSLPVIILHAKDDMVVPFNLGLKLYRAVLTSRTEDDAPIKLHAYSKDRGLGHKWICNADDLDEVVGDFVKTHQ